jgi:putative ABC transport system permease protein
VFRVALRTAGVPDSVSESVRRAVNSVDAEIPIAEVRTMSAVIDKSSEERRFQTALLTGFALTAVLLAAIGIYGVVAYSALQRRKEVAVRVALGATSRNITLLVFRNGMVPVLAGLLSGVIVAVFLANFIATLLFGISALDAITFIGAALVLATAGAFPCWLTARRASRLEPAGCLRLD